MPTKREMINALLDEVMRLVMDGRDEFDEHDQRDIAATVGFLRREVNGDFKR